MFSVRKKKLQESFEAIFIIDAVKILSNNLPCGYKSDVIRAPISMEVLLLMVNPNEEAVRDKENQNLSRL